MMAGLYFEEFEVGQEFHHEFSRTVTEMDNTMFSLLTMNPQPLHIDAHFSENTEFGQRLFNSLYTLGIMIGMSAHDTNVRAHHDQSARRGGGKLPPHWPDALQTEGVRRCDPSCSFPAIASANSRAPRR